MREVYSRVVVLRPVAVGEGGLRNTPSYESAGEIVEKANEKERD
ncbi:MAG TPA: hypothetical protein VGC66_02090 [Pyrinomonadaceae bacterium]